MNHGPEMDLAVLLPGTESVIYDYNWEYDEWGNKIKDTVLTWGGSGTQERSKRGPNAMQDEGRGRREVVLSRLKLLGILSSSQPKTGVMENAERCCVNSKTLKSDGVQSHFNSKVPSVDLG